MIKGELFSTEMVEALLSGNKRRTSRPVKFNFKDVYRAACFQGKWDVAYGKHIPDHIKEWYMGGWARPKYQPGDIMYVRETWTETQGAADMGLYIYKACAGQEDEDLQYALDRDRWRPSIHMPKDAARIFLRITHVDVQRLGAMSEWDAIEDGFNYQSIELALTAFKDFWKRQYGPDAQWMWVYWFEQISKEEALGGTL